MMRGEVCRFHGAFCHCAIKAVRPIKYSTPRKIVARNAGKDKARGLHKTAVAGPPDDISTAIDVALKTETLHFALSPTCGHVPAPDEDFGNSLCILRASSCASLNILRIVAPSQKPIARSISISRSIRGLVFTLAQTPIWSWCRRISIVDVIKSPTDWLRGDLVGSEPFGRQIPVLLSTERACDDHRAEWKLLHTHGNIPPTLPALDNELLSTL